MKYRALLSLLLLFSAGSYAQTAPHRPKVGLVLSGGGAKGFAHIGVLKVLEDAGVKVDYIGGTSMGAIVGGLYASGYNARQIDSIFQATDFDALLQDFIPRSSKSFYGKRNDELYAISLPFNKFRFGLPTALSKGLYNYNLLARLTQNVRHVRDFSKLPIPFLCIATDIESGKQVVLDKGYLPQAMAASAAFPSLFAPVEIDGHMLIDGGVVNNYPIEEIQKMGADIIIGVDVQDDLKNRDQLQDATHIMVQITNLGMIERMKQNARNTDIYIKPDIKDFGVISFDEGKEIIRKGEEAAFSVYEQLRELGEKQGNYHRPDLKVCNDSLYVKQISINKLDNFTRSYVLGRLRFRQNREISYDQLKIGTDNLAATDNFSSINYSLEPDGNGDDLKFSLTPNNIRNYLKFGVHYDDLYKTGVLVNFTRKKLFLRNDVASFDVVLGDNIRYNFDYYIDNGFYFSFGFKSKFTQFSRNVATDFNDGELLEQLSLNTINLDFSDLTNQAYLQTVFVQKYLIAGGLEHKHLKIKSETLGDDQPVFENSDYLSVFGYLKYDSFDNRYFPKHGWYLSGDFQSYLSSSNHTGNFKRFSIAKGEIGSAYTVWKKFTLKLQAEGGFAIGPDSVPFFDFVLGGYGFSPVINIRSFYGYDFLSFSGDSYIKAVGTFDWEFYKKNHFNFAANAAQIGDGLFDSPDWLTDKPMLGYAIGYGMESFIGPLEVKYSWSPEVGRGYTWFSVGFWF